MASKEWVESGDLDVHTTAVTTPVASSLTTEATASMSTQVTASVSTEVTASVSTEVAASVSTEVNADAVDLSSVFLSEAMTNLNVREQSDIISVERLNLLHSVDAKQTGESSSPLLYDITVSHSGQHVIVTDCWNRCVKAFDLTITDCPCTSVFQLKEECPLCITKLSHPERVVITLHQRSELYVLNIHENDDSHETDDTQKSVNGQETHDVKETQDIHHTENTSEKRRQQQKRVSEVLTFHSVIATSCNYRGISTLCRQTAGDTQEQLVLTLPKEIHVISLKGDIVQVIAPSLCGLPLLMDVIYITTTRSQDLVVTDVGARRVLCFTLSGCLRWCHPSLQLSEEEKQQGETGVFKGMKSPGDEQGECSVNIFKGVQWPLGVASDPWGQVLVCDLELHSVVLLTSDGASARLLLTKKQALHYPRGLSISNGCLCLTQDDCIKIFCMTQDY